MDPVYVVMEYAKRYDRVCVNNIPIHYRDPFCALWGDDADNALSYFSRPFSLRFVNGHIAGCMMIRYNSAFQDEHYHIIDYQDLMALYSYLNEPDFHVSLQEVL